MTTTRDDDTLAGLLARPARKGGGALYALMPVNKIAADADVAGRREHGVPGAARDAARHALAVCYHCGGGRPSSRSASAPPGRAAVVVRAARWRSTRC